MKKFKQTAAITLLLAVVLMSFPLCCAAAEPVLLLPTDGAVLHEGEAITVRSNVVPEAGGAAYICVDGAVADSFFEGETAETELVGLTAGSYAVTVQSISSVGAKTESAAATVTVLANAAPQIAVSGLEGVMGEAALAAVPVSVTDSDSAIAETEVYLNGALVGTYTENDFYADLTDSAVGENELTIVAADAYGKKAEKVISFTAEKLADAYLFTSEFDTDSSSVLKSGNGVSRSIDESETLGNCLKLSTSSKSNLADVGPNVNLEVASGGGKLTYYIEADLCLPVEDISFLLGFRNETNGSQLKMCEFTKDGTINLMGEGGTVTSDSSLLTYTHGEVYHLKAVINAGARTYDLFIDGEQLAAGRYLDNYKNCTGISYIRFMIYNYADASRHIYMDNLSVKTQTQVPRISAVTAADGSTVQNGASELVMPLVGTMGTEDVTSYLTLSGPCGTVPVSTAIYDSAQDAVLVTAAAPLTGGTYTAVFNDALPITKTTKTGAAVRKSFTVEGAGGVMCSADFSFEGAALRLNAKIDSHNGETAAAVVYLWKNGRLCGIFTGKQETGEAGVSVTCAPMASGMRATAYLFYADDVIKPLTAETFTFVVQ